MAEAESPLGPAYLAGRHGNVRAETGVTLTETRPGSIVQVAAWPGRSPAALAAIGAATGLVLEDRPGAGACDATRAAFGMAPGRYLVVDQAEGLAARLLDRIAAEIGSVTDLSHGRTAIRLAGARSEWVLSKFFAIDFAQFPVGAGISTAHHDIFAQIQRTAADQFDIYVFRSFARSFWTSLCHASAEVGYDVR